MISEKRKFNKKKYKRIFKKGSKTYYYSSIFFSKKVKLDVMVLYSFVRIADDFIDSIPQQKDDFFKFKKLTYEALDGKEISDYEYDFLINDFVELFNRKEFEKNWLDSFFNSMENDLEIVEMKTLKETEEYIYGSAEVVGLFMAKILDLDKESYHYAKMLGKSMQYINFIRDFNEDIKLKRTYLPIDDAKQFNLDNLSKSTIFKNKEFFEMFIRKQVNLFFDWDKEARKGFKYIKKRDLIPIKTAQDAYYWTAKQIYKDPFIIFKKKVKPSKSKIIYFAIRNVF